MYSGTSNNATNLNGQAAAYYTNATNISTGTLPAAQLPALGFANATNGLAISGLAATATNASQLGGNLPAFYTNATNIATGTLPAAQLPALSFANSTNGLGINGTATNATNATNAANAALLNSQNGAFYTNATNIATGTLPAAQLPALGFANATNGLGISGLAATATDAAQLGGNLPAFYTNATNIATGTLPAAQLPALGFANSTNGLGISGLAATATNAANAALLNSQNGAYYTNATNIATGTLPAAQLPALGFANSTNGLGINGTVTNATNAANAALLNSQNGAYYTNATNIATGTLPAAQLPSTTVNTSGAFTLTGVLTHSANIVMSNNVVESPKLKAYKEFVNTLSISTTTQTLDLSTTNIYNLTLANASITLTFSNPPATGNAYTLTILAKQDATGSRVITFPASVKWPNSVTPTLSTTANKTDILSFFTVDGGTNYYAGVALSNTG